MKTCYKAVSWMTILMMLVLAVACGSADEQAQGKVRLVVAVPADVATLDAHVEANSNTSHLIQVFESLLEVDADLEIQPALATAWRSINDTTWEFDLRKDVKFHDGSSFTAEDVKWSYDRIMNAGADSGVRKIYAGWFKGVEIVDDYKVRLLTEAPYPVAITQIASMPTIMSKAQHEKVGDEGLAKTPVGTGPYKVVEWKVNESLALEAFEDYWGEEPAVDELVFRVIPDESTRVAELLSGGADLLIDIPLARIAELKEASNVKVTSKQGVLNFYMGMNTAQVPFDDVKVRQAIAHALDVETIIGTVLGGYGEHANSLVQGTSFGWNPDLKPFEYDPELSKQLLAEAGYPSGFETALDAGPGVWPATEEAAEAIAGYLEDVGIRTQVKIAEFGDYFERYRGTALPGLFLWGNVANELDADVQVNLNFHCPPTGRGLYWCSAETDQLIDQTRTELDTAKRQDLFNQIQQTFHDEVVAVPLWNYEQVGATSMRFDWEPRGDFYFWIADVKLSE